MDETTRLVVGTAMREMIQKGWVNICTIEKCIALSGIIPRAQPLALLHALHCVNFKDMPSELQERVPALLRDVFNGFDIQALTDAVTPAGGKALRLQQGSGR